VKSADDFHVASPPASAATRRGARNLAKFPKWCLIISRPDPGGRRLRKKAAQIVANVAKEMRRQFSAIILSEPVMGPVETAAGGSWDFLRVHFKIWPGQGSLFK
jgi:hypothetical protein